MTTISVRSILAGSFMLAALTLGGAGAAGAQTITISGCASLTTSGGTGVSNISITCNQASSPGSTPPSCTAPTITPVGSSAAPTSLILSSTCTPGSRAITSVTAAGQSLTAGLPTTAPYVVTVSNIPVPAIVTTYTVSASDGTLTGSASSTYTPPASPAPAPIGGPISCADKGFTTTQYYDWDWAQSGLNIYTDISSSGTRNPQGPIGPNGIVVIGFTTHATAFGSSGSVTIAPFPGDIHGATRTMSISTSPCDFSKPFPWTRTGYDVGIQFTVGDFIPDVYPPLVAGAKYYINIATRDAAGVSTCAAGGRACDMVVKANKP